MRVGRVHRRTTVPPLRDKTSSRRVQLIEAGAREAKTVVVVAGLDRTPDSPVGALRGGRRLELEWS